MNQSSSRAFASSANDAQSNAQVRKALLLVRAEMERIELGQRVVDVRQEVQPGTLMRAVLPRLTAGGGANSAMKVLGLVRKYPMLWSGAASWLLSSGSKVFKVAKYGGAGWLAWQAYKLWKDAEPEPRDRR